MVLDVPEEIPITLGKGDTAPAPWFAPKRFEHESGPIPELEPEPELRPVVVPNRKRRYQKPRDLEIPCPPCKWCGGETRRFGYDRHGTRCYRCRACARRSYADGYLPKEWHTNLSEEKVVVLIAAARGHLSVKQASALVRVAYKTAARFYRLYASRNGPILCGCGESVRHAGWCEWRKNRAVLVDPGKKWVRLDPRARGNPKKILQ
jgi:hypothetical protein